ncbi:hypothetical protein CCR75_003539 [Bremia lactucae]|uniref:Uncharacterized protein n=1 Tax=Bremia lactucae TaxID=4779 RepID=A0A976NXN2_BRELC|nr:hypothetical protein CCR75_003539 [Bremia lactucae]
MTNIKGTCCQGTTGQLALYNPHSVPAEGIMRLKRSGGLPCRSDVMISQQKGIFPPSAFMLIHKDTPGFSPKSTIERLQKAEKAFQYVFAIAIFPIPNFLELQQHAISTSMHTKILPVFSQSSAVKLVVSVHEKLNLQISEKADLLYKHMNEELLTYENAMDILRVNLPILTVDECEMLLDLFGSIASIAQAGAEKLLDVTVLSTSKARAIEEFFSCEYAVD